MMVIWLLGISGAGKSTLGTKLYNTLSKNSKKVYLLDGDEIRKFFDSDLGYTKDDRIANIKRIIYAAYVLSQNDIYVIVCNISPFESLRNFCRNKIPNYYQIYLKKSLEKSIENDVKQIYNQNLGKTDLVGVDLKFEEPIENDLVISVDELSINDSLNLILEKLVIWDKAL